MIQSGNNRKIDQSLQYELPNVIVLHSFGAQRMERYEESVLPVPDPLIFSAQLTNRLLNERFRRNFMT